MCRFGHPSNFPQWRRRDSVGQRSIPLHHRLVVSVTGAEHPQALLVAWLTPLGARYHTTVNRLAHQRAFGTSAPIAPAPGRISTRLTPRLDAVPGTRRPMPPAARRWWRALQSTPRRVRRDGQQGRRPPGRQATTQPIRAPPLGVPRHPPMRQRGTVWLTPLQRPLVTRARGS
jgi:hypothetical protein